MSGYYTGFSTHENPMSVIVAGVVSGTATIASGYSGHIELADGGVSGNPYYDPFAAAVEAALNAVGAGFTVSFSSTTNAYTITHSGGSFSLNFSGHADGPALGNALGMPNGFYAAAASHVSDATPYYVIEPAHDARSGFTNTYEPEGIVQEAVADGGTAYGIAMETTELHCDWVQRLESKSATISHVATSTVPWTWQHFFRHCRASHPFTVIDAISNVEGGRVYKLRADGAAGTKAVIQLFQDDWEELWNISIAARDLGELP